MTNWLIEYYVKNPDKAIPDWVEPSTREAIEVGRRSSRLPDAPVAEAETFQFSPLHGVSTGVTRAPPPSEPTPHDPIRAAGMTYSHYREQMKEAGRQIEANLQQIKDAPPESVWVYQDKNWSQARMVAELERLKAENKRALIEWGNTYQRWKEQNAPWLVKGGAGISQVEFQRQVRVAETPPSLTSEYLKGTFVSPDVPFEEAARQQPLSFYEATLRAREERLERLGLTPSELGAITPLEKIREATKAAAGAVYSFAPWEIAQTFTIMSVEIAKDVKKHGVRGIIGYAPHEEFEKALTPEERALGFWGEARSIAERPYPAIGAILGTTGVMAGEMLIRDVKARAAPKEYKVTELLGYEMYDAQPLIFEEGIYMPKEGAPEPTYILETRQRIVEAKQPPKVPEVVPVEFQREAGFITKEMVGELKDIPKEVRVKVVEVEGGRFIPREELLKHDTKPIVEALEEPFVSVVYEKGKPIEIPFEELYDPFATEIKTPIVEKVKRKVSPITEKLSPEVEIIKPEVAAKKLFEKPKMLDYEFLKAPTAKDLLKAEVTSRLRTQMKDVLKEKITEKLPILEVEKVSKTQKAQRAKVSDLVYGATPSYAEIVSAYQEPSLVKPRRGETALEPMRMPSTGAEPIIGLQPLAGMEQSLGQISLVSPMEARKVRRETRRKVKPDLFETPIDLQLPDTRPKSMVKPMRIQAQRMRQERIVEPRTKLLEDATTISRGLEITRGMRFKPPIGIIERKPIARKKRRRREETIVGRGVRYTPSLGGLALAKRIEKAPPLVTGFGIRPPKSKLKVKKKMSL